MKENMKYVYSRNLIQCDYRGFKHLYMEKFAEIMVIVFVLGNVEAQVMQQNSKPESFHSARPTVPIIVTMLSFMLALTFLMLAYAKFCHRNQSYRSNPYRQDNNPVELVLPGTRLSGIDKKAIESLPFFKFSALKGEKQGLECAVCITKFEDSEILRLLPHCKHAFHMACIDQWLENHSSCPLCRNKLDAKEIQNFAYSNSWRFLQNPSNLSDDLNVELFVQREESTHGSSRSSSFRLSDKGKEEELLVLDNDCYNGDGKLLRKFKHRIVMSDVVVKNRWSDVNSSDMIFLRSEMLGALSSKRFSDSRSARISNPAEKRSMSEITNYSRIEYGLTSADKDSPSDERITRLWLPAVRRTLQWFAGREKQSRAVLHNSNI